MASAGDDPIVTDPTWLGNIRFFFTQGDIDCMTPRGVDLGTYDGVKDHATNIYLQTQSGNMPMGGPAWSANKVQTFLNWMTTGYPMGSAEPAPEPAVRLSDAGVRLRKNINALSAAELATLTGAFEAMMALPPDNTNSYYYVASQHGVPLLYCMHHVQPFAPWHRLYMRMFEDALRAQPGCADLTLPYWDVTTVAPGWLFQPPFASYTVPVTLPNYGANYTTSRYDAQTIWNNYQNAPSILSSITDAVGESLFGAMNQGGFEDSLVQGHDNAHDEAGPTLQDPNVASFDPIFWFFHCNWDRVWASWQHNANAMTVKDFTATLGGNTGWLMLPLQPWTQNSTATVVEADVQYDELIGGDAAMRKAKTGHVSAEASFALAVSDEVSVRVKDINRLDIPGTFRVRLLADGEPIARQAFFQAPAPRDCPTCSQQPLVSIDFRVPQSAIAGKTLSVAIEVPSLGEGDMARFPLSSAGSPTINIRHLLEER